MKRFWVLFLLLLFAGCGADSLESLEEKTQEAEIPHRPTEAITYAFGDVGWETRIKPGMSQIELLEVWGRPWSAYKYPPKLPVSPECDAWCYYTLGKDFAIVLWSYDAKEWKAPPELAAAVWGKFSDEKYSGKKVTIYGAISGDKFLTDEAEIKRLYTLLYINYWKVKLL